MRSSLSYDFFGVPGVGVAGGVVCVPGPAGVAGAVVAGVLPPAGAGAGAAAAGFGAGIGSGLSACVRNHAIRLRRSCSLLIPAKLIFVPGT